MLEQEFKSLISKEQFEKIRDNYAWEKEFTQVNHYYFDENDYIIKCKIVENNETVFEVKTCAGSRQRAKRIVDNWNKNANLIYPEILNLLLKN